MMNPLRAGDRAQCVAALLLPTLALLACSGCRMFEAPVAGAAQPALNWFANFSNDDAQMSPPLDINSIRPTPQTAPVQPGDLLEITVSNLFQPEEPHTFPARIHTDGSLEIPLLGQPVVTGLTRADIEKGLKDEYQRRELLVNPTVIVRELEVPRVKVYVEGAVERPGIIALPREDASVYSALVSAGLKTNAGGQISVARPLNLQAAAPIAETAALFALADETLDPIPGETPGGAVNPLPLESEIMSEDPLEMAADQIAPAIAAAPEVDAVAGDQPQSGSPGTEYEIIWFDAQREEDRRALIELQLGEGDIVGVSELVPPIKVLGSVQNPGAFNIPNSNDITLLDAVRLAGGVKDEGNALKITLIRMNETGWPGRNWSRSWAELEANPQQSPAIQPGDVIHVERPAGSKLKQTVEGWLSK
ncbi:SLBB domain protein [Symmachiella dynata]|uniref:polysaccharide biosynthesis/export family protein n=1 Tax=Symmachiella dynata TaxID=2527995 RepID=UPI00118CB16E|nr:SLBB domain-containing protein [Symmachiella dynata]QDT47978.1 SLBB domain protein [Symmachiella dynata]